MCALMKIKGTVSGFMDAFVHFLWGTCSRSVALGKAGEVMEQAHLLLGKLGVADEPEGAGLTRLLLLLSQITSWDSRAITFTASLLWHAAFRWHRAAPASSTDLRRKSSVHRQFSCPVRPRLPSQISDSVAVSHLLQPLLGLIPALSAWGGEVLFTELVFSLCREVTTCSVPRMRCTGTTGTKPPMLFIRHLAVGQSQDRNSFC